MPIQPKYGLGAKRPLAIRQFTDRENFIEAFTAAFRSGPQEQPRVLVYYGVGGVGKTTLRKQLGKLIDAERPDTVHTVIDFDVPNYRDQETALFVLRKALQEKFKVQFRTFDVAYAVYWQKTRPHTPMTKENFPLLEDGQVLADILSFAGAVPIAGVIPKIALVLAWGGKMALDWWAKRGHTELKDLPELEPNEIAERLPMYWASSLKDHLDQKGLPAVIFLDTYEALWESERAEGTYHLRDDWVRELVAQLPEVLWVVCGRERLRWEDLDPDWRQCLDQHLVGGLADADARSLLVSCGITDAPVQQAVIEGSEGMPYYIDLAIDTYFTIKDRQQRDPLPADFARSPKEVFARFLRHLTGPETETLKVLSAPRFWDYPLFETLVKQYHTGYPVTAFSDLCRFAFIYESEKPGTWSMHHVMRESLQQHQDPDLNRRVHRFMFELYTAQATGLELQNVTDRHRIALAEAFYHGRLVLEPAALMTWLLETAATFEEAAQWKFLIPLFEEAVQFLRSAPDSGPSDVAGALNFLANLWRDTGRYPEAERSHREALAIREKGLPPDSPELAESLNNLGMLLCDQGKYAEAESLEQRAAQIREKALGPEHSALAQSLNNLGMLYWYMGRFRDAEPLLLRALAIDEKALGPDSPVLARRLNNLAALRYLQRKYAEAEPLYRRALEIREKVLGPSHPDTATSLNNLATLFYCEGKLNEAAPLLERALAIREAALGPDHPEVAQCTSNLAGLRRDQDRYAEAEQLYRKAIDGYERALGPDHPEYAKSLSSLANLFRMWRRFDEAEQLYRQALAVNEKALGPEHTEVARSLNGLAGIYREQERYAEAEPLLRRALAINEKALGPEHPDLAEGLEGLAAVCRSLGKAPEAEVLAARAKKIRGL